MDRGQKHIYTPVKHLKWSPLEKILKAVSYFQVPSWMYDWVLNTPLEGLLQDARREEVVIAPVIEFYYHQ